MTTRQEREAKEAEARNKADGWVGELVAWIPMGIIVTVILFLLMWGMYAIEMASVTSM